MSDSGRIEYFLEMLSAERGAAINTLDSYARLPQKTALPLHL